MRPARLGGKRAAIRPVVPGGPYMQGVPSIPGMHAMLRAPQAKFMFARSTVTVR